MFLLNSNRNRTRDFQRTVTQEDGSTPVVLAATDSVRFKAGRGTSEPALELVSSEISANGSTVTINDTETGAITIRIAAGDTAGLEPGAYDAEILVVDDSETAPIDAAKYSVHGVLMIHPTLAGDLDIEESSSG